LKSLTFAEIDALRLASADLSYDAPRFRAREVVSLSDARPRSPDRFAVLLTDEYGNQRVWGAVAGRWTVDPAMSKATADYVAARKN